jgi:hypothetical protein
VDRFDAHARGDALQSSDERVDLRPPDVRVLEQDLPVEVRRLHAVLVDHGELVEPGSREGERRGGSDAARPDQEDASRHLPSSATKYSSRLK